MEQNGKIFCKKCFFFKLSPAVTFRIIAKILSETQFVLNVRTKENSATQKVFFSQLKLIECFQHCI